MPLLTELFNRIPKRNLSGSLRELGINNFQSLEIPTSEVVLSNLKSNGFNKNELTSFINNSNDSQRIPIEENAKRALNFNTSFNFNSYPTPPNSPSFYLDPEGSSAVDSGGLVVFMFYIPLGPVISIEVELF